MKRSGVVVALLSLMAAVLMSGAPAQALIPASYCYNGTWLGTSAVICQIDVNDDKIVNDYDITRLAIPISRVLIDSQLYTLTQAVDDLDFAACDQATLTETVDRVLRSFIPPVLRGPLYVTPCLQVERSSY